MAKLKRYTSFDSLKSDQKAGNADINKENYSEFEAFVKRLQKEYSNKKKAKTDNGKQLDR